MEARLAGGAERILISSLMTLVSIALQTFTDLFIIIPLCFWEIYFRAARFRVGTGYLLLYAALYGIGSHFVS